MSNDFKFHGNTGGSLSGNFDLGDGSWTATQDINPVFEDIKLDKEIADDASGRPNTQMHYKKFATVPDVVAIEIYQKYGINCHHEDFLQDVDAKAKFFTIIRQEYPHCTINKQEA